MHCHWPPDLLEIHVPLYVCHRGVDALPPPVRVTWISSRSGGGNASTPVSYPCNRDIETWLFSISGGGNASTSIGARIIIQSRQENFKE